jgi:transcription termination factor Rho
MRKPVPAGMNDGPTAPVAAPSPTPSTSSSPLPPAHANATRLDDLYRLPMPKLFAFAEKEGLFEHTGMNRGQLIMSVVRRQIERGLVVRGSGTLEVLPDGYGFLRSSAHNYLASPEDIYVSPSQIRRVGLKTGLVVEGPIRLPVEGQDNFALMQVDLVNGMNPEERISPTTFEDLTPCIPIAGSCWKPAPKSSTCASSIW